ncbi:activating signal cointegrator 1 complex subunit [Ataeniobius toweri]|uniref:Activating signal cointegrator 1 complex subunit n=1 Tax=Ataeniobius toweri TaxID=208326 RepID=A0ABU7C276_9TELE|nr:activating signal cointegrator 1 complex subunit [Ataeniobius toweri]
MLDVAANEGWLVTALSICNLVQMIVQGRWLHDSSLLTLPHVEQQHLYLFRKWASKKGRSGAEGFCGLVEGLPELIAACSGKESVFSAIVSQEFHHSQILQSRAMSSLATVMRDASQIPNYSFNLSANCYSNERVRPQQQAL